MAEKTNAVGSKVCYFSRININPSVRCNGLTLSGTQGLESIPAVYSEQSIQALNNTCWQFRDAN